MNTGNHLYINASGAVTYVLVHNFDSDNNGTPNSLFFFNHYQVGAFTGDIGEIDYSVPGQVTAKGKTNRTGVRFETVYKIGGGYYGLGSASLKLFSETKTLVNILNTTPSNGLRINGATLSITPSGEDLDLLSEG